jgi:hypothetical protein
LFGAIVTGAFSWLICYQSKIDLLSLVPNTFMGGFSAFASGGDWKMLCICHNYTHMKLLSLFFSTNDYDCILRDT